MTATVLPNGKNYFADSTGAPLSGGKVYAYVPGTSTPKDTYTTSAGTVANTNPVVLDSRGEAAIYWNGTYDVVLKTSADVTVWGPERVESPSVGDDAVRSDLANTVDAAKGSGLVGFNVSLNYTAGSIGKYLYDIFKAGGVLPATSGVNLTSLNASNLGSGTVPAARIGSATAYDISASLVNSNPVGYRNLPSASVTTGAFVAADAGKCVYATAGVTIPNSTMAAGDRVVIQNTTGSAITITKSVATAYMASAPASFGATFSLPARARIEVLFTSSTECYVFGSGGFSGVYTPTIVAVANITSGTQLPCMWTLTGDVLAVSGRVGIDPTTASTLTQLGIPLPITSNLANTYDLAGVGVSGEANPNYSAHIYGDTANDRAVLEFFCGTDVTARTWSFQFSCVVK